MENYKLLDKIGGGYSCYTRIFILSAYGEVFTAEQKSTGNIVAVKRIQRFRTNYKGETVDIADKIKEEVIVMNKFQSPYIAKVFDYIVDEKHGNVCFFEL